MLNLNWEKIHSIILSITCHGLRNFPLLIHIPLYPFVNFWNPMSYYFLSLSFDPPHPYMTHPTPTPPLHDPPHPTPTWHPPPHPTPSWPTLHHPTPTLHDPPTPTPPHPWYIFGHKGAVFYGLLHCVSLIIIIIWVRVTHKKLNVNWENIHSLILSVTCHGLRNFPWLIHIPSNPFMNFWNPTSYYFLS